jgi:threonine/homoserine/homoserine lactone efflux protein
VSASPLLGATLLNGFLLGWSVSWPPGPVNAEMIRRGVIPRLDGGGFWPAWRVGLGACTGDFLWALGVATGAGALVGTRSVRIALAAVSLAVLLLLASIYSVGAWRTLKARKPPATPPQNARTKRRVTGGYLLGFMLAVTSPWNLGFWLAVIGGQQVGKIGGTFGSSLTLAAAVVSGAVTWTLVLCFAVKAGARIFARPSWQFATQALTAAIMIWFAAKVALQFR